MSTVFPTVDVSASRVETSRETNWETGIVSSTIRDGDLDIVVDTPLPREVNWETLLLVENDAKFSGIWRVRKVCPDRKTVVCIPVDGVLGNEYPHYAFSLRRSELCGLVIGRPNKEGWEKATLSIAPPLRMKVRCAVLSVSKVDTVEQSFQADVFCECRLRRISTVEDHAAMDVILRAYGLEKKDMPVICLLNTDVEVERWETFGQSGTASDFDYTFKFRAKGTFSEQYELERFPFDEQLLNITATVLKSHQLIRLEANEEYPSSFVVSNFQMSNVFTVVYQDMVLSRRAFSSAKESASGVVYPRFTMSILLQRKPMYYITNIALPMMVLTYLAFLSFAVGLDGGRLDTPDRLSITLTLLLTAVAYKFVVASAIPQVSYLTWLDQYISFCFTYLCVITGENALFPLLETRRGWSIDGDSEIYVFYALIGLFTLVNVAWLGYVWFALRLQHKRYQLIRQVEEVRREVAQRQQQLRNEGAEGDDVCAPSGDRLRELVVKELLSRGVDVLKDADLCHLLDIARS